MWLFLLRERPTAPTPRLFFLFVCTAELIWGNFLHALHIKADMDPADSLLLTHRHVHTSACTHTIAPNCADNAASRCEHTELQILHICSSTLGTCAHTRALWHTDTNPPRAECCQSNILSIEDFCPILSNWFPCCLLHLGPSIILPAKSIGLI